MTEDRLSSIVWRPGAWEKRVARGCRIDRDRAISRICQGKRVLHLGAADSPFHEEKAQAGCLLHQRIRAIATSIVGVDSDESAIAALRRFGIDDIVLGDIINYHFAADTEPFDVVLCCDIIEHVDDQRSLLDACRRYLAPGGVVVVTTINGTSIKAALRAVFGREAVHPQHVAYYSFGTLSEVLRRNRLEPLDVGYFVYPTQTRAARWFFGALSWVGPMSGDGILITSCPNLAEEQHGPDMSAAA